MPRVVGYKRIDPRRIPFRPGSPSLHLSLSRESVTEIEGEELKRIHGYVQLSTMVIDEPLGEERTSLRHVARGIVDGDGTWIRERESIDSTRWKESFRGAGPRRNARVHSHAIFLALDRSFLSYRTRNQAYVSIRSQTKRFSSRPRPRPRSDPDVLFSSLESIALEPESSTRCFFAKGDRNEPRLKEMEMHSILRNPTPGNRRGIDTCRFVASRSTKRSTRARARVVFVEKGRSSDSCARDVSERGTVQRDRAS